MKITASDKRLKVAFQLPGKRYGQPSATQYPSDIVPFEEHDVEIGETWTLPEGGTFVFVKEYLPTAPDGDTFKGA